MANQVMVDMWLADQSKSPVGPVHSGRPAKSCSLLGSAVVEVTKRILSERSDQHCAKGQMLFLLFHQEGHPEPEKGVKGLGPKPNQ